MLVGNVLAKKSKFKQEVLDKINLSEALIEHCSKSTCINAIISKA